MNQITYAIDTTTGLVWSRMDSELAVPILEYDKMSPANNFETSYYLEKMSVFEAAGYWWALKWTRKIPIAIKNTHRSFWGLRLLKEKAKNNEKL